MKYVCVSATVNGQKLDASMLGGTYSILFRHTGKADFVEAGMTGPELNWHMDGSNAVVEYYGQELRFTPGTDTLDLDYLGTMILHFQPQK